MARYTQDKELEQYRNLLKPPAQFEDGFSWTTIAGIFFCGLIMLPGSIYLEDGRRRRVFGHADHAWKHVSVSGRGT